MDSVVGVGFDVGKSEHGGAKKGEGGWGPKVLAKAGARKLRRANDRVSVIDERSETELTMTMQTGGSRSGK